jgi:hypothetical protein
MASRHRQVAVKVNAWADEGVAPLVEALSEFPGVLTLDSCQGGEEDTRWAKVRFRVGWTGERMGSS